MISLLYFLVWFAAVGALLALFVLVKTGWIVDYALTDDAIALVFFKRFSYRYILYADIESAKYIPAWKARGYMGFKTRYFGYEAILIIKSSGPFYRVSITPDEPVAFMEELQAHISPR